MTTDAHEIPVSLVCGMKPWIVSTKARLGVMNDDVVGQSRVEPKDPALPGNVVRARKARHLTEGVDASVGPAASFDRRMLESHLVDGLLDHPLNGAKAGLRLPPVKVGAVIAEAQADAVRELQLLFAHLSPAGR